MRGDFGIQPWKLLEEQMRQVLNLMIMTSTVLTSGPITADLVAFILDCPVLYTVSVAATNKHYAAQTFSVDLC